MALLKRLISRSALALGIGLSSFAANSQVTESFTVLGDINTYYPVAFLDGGYANNVATQLKLGRSSVHDGATWRGSFIADFSYHTYNWGNGAAFIKANISRGANASSAIQDFIGGWRDVTTANNNATILIWLRGGGTRYYYQSNYTVSPQVFDGQEGRAATYSETGGSTYGSRLTIDPNINQHGLTDPLRVWYTGASSNYFAGNIGLGTTTPVTKLHINQGKAVITSSESTYGQLQVLNPLDGEAAIVIGANGTGMVSSRTTYARQWQIGIGSYNSGINNLVITNPTTLDKGFVFSYEGKMGIGANVFPAGEPYRLYVEGGIRTRKIKVDQAAWADYVFDSSYQLRPLQQVEAFIKTNKHLPEVPSAEAVKKEGTDVADTQALLLKKIEELTLYIIEQEKRLKSVEQELSDIKKKK
ncbi:hypothetical protein HNQ91_001159 [Filimonas zeae]|uniref:Peptidase S74 domain-containing protein n=1 Tax=Filimonas zeae TaxID=1737353 RepID=A0A917IRY6_9BACT|nr:hypothetical protein [Filimonas zeae]MDR6338137.1 hypothetical protein [Filimonas zeae]GGH61904.1 hypothetical protein GCM10011379_11340 [Filimonas zeae]